MPFSLIIVEDEDYVRDALAEMIRWDSVDCRMEAAFADGDEALAYLERTPVDIVLSDIRMDRIDGLELAERARFLRPSVEFVFVTGYGDLDCARRALRQHAWDFLLKPTQPEELLSTFARLTERLRRRKEEERRVDTLEATLRDSIPAVRRGLLVQLANPLAADPAAESALARRLSEVGIDIDGVTASTVGPARDEMAGEHVGFLRALAVALVDRGHGDGGTSVWIPFPDDAVTFLFPATQARRRTRDLVQALADRHHVRVDAGLAGPASGVVAVRAAIQEASARFALASSAVGARVETGRRGSVHDRALLESGSRGGGLHREAGSEGETGSDADARIDGVSNDQRWGAALGGGSSWPPIAAGAHSIAEEAIDEVYALVGSVTAGHVEEVRATLSRVVEQLVSTGHVAGIRAATERVRFLAEYAASAAGLHPSRLRSVAVAEGAQGGPLPGTSVVRRETDAPNPARAGGSTPVDPIRLRAGLHAAADSLIAVAEAASNRAARPESRVESVTRYLSQHYMEPVGLKDVARACAINPKYLCRLLRRELGKTFTQLRNEVRIKHAEVLLASAQLSIADVAYAVGYTDAAYFSRAFAREREESPSEFRRRLRAHASL